MDINAGNINALTGSLNLLFNKALAVATGYYQPFSYDVTSTSGEELYPRLDELTGLEEWIGQRNIQELNLKDAMRIINKTYQSSFSIRREDIEDMKENSNYAFLQPVMAVQATNAQAWPDKLIFDLIDEGHKKKSMDGQNFFDADHIGYDRSKKVISASNILRPSANEGVVPPWYLVDTSSPVKPMIFQRRRAFAMTALTKLDSDNVFKENRFVWGIDGRCNAGYGIHNFMMRCTCPMTVDNIEKALGMMKGQCRKDGIPYDIKPDMILTPTNYEADALRLMKADYAPQTSASGQVVTGGNPYKNYFKVSTIPYLRRDVIND